MGSTETKNKKPRKGRNMIVVVSPLRGYHINHVMFPRLTPWATDLSPLRG
jgi:hypothetical protein